MISQLRKSSSYQFHFIFLQTLLILSAKSVPQKCSPTLLTARGTTTVAPWRETRFWDATSGNAHTPSSSTSRVCAVWTGKPLTVGGATNPRTHVSSRSLSQTGRNLTSRCLDGSTKILIDVILKMKSRIA